VVCSSVLSSAQEDSSYEVDQDDPPQLVHGPGISSIPATNRQVPGTMPAMR